MSGTTVTVKWTDRSTTEDSFVLMRRESGQTYPVNRFERATTSRSGSGQTYTATDTIPAGTRHCYTIQNYDYAGIVGGNLSNEVCTSALPAVPAPALGVGIASSLDPAAFSGQANSTTIGADGLGITVSYKGDGALGTGLRVSHCEDTECTSATSNTLDLPSRGISGHNPSIKIGSDGLPLISYISLMLNGVCTEDLKVAHCVDVVCSSATVTTVDSASRVGGNTSLVIGKDGLGMIAYNHNKKAIKVAKCQNVACTSATTRDVEVVGANGQQFLTKVSMAASPTGLTYLAYLEDGQGSPDNLKMATLNDDGTGYSNWTLAITEGFSHSVTIGRDGLALVSYVDQNASFGSDLTVAHCLNYTCTVSTKNVLDSGGSIFRHGNTSISLGADGFGVISYQDSTSKNLVVAHCNNSACSTASHGTLLDEFGDVGAHTSMAIGSDGLPLVSYYDRTNDNLKVAHCADAACAEPLIAPFFKQK